MHVNCLIVDDETVIADATCEYFNLFELSSACVYGYEECLHFLRENTASLILLDINLAGQSGFALCKKLREQTDIPILFISARDTDDDILTAFNIGGDDYITKPYTLSILLAKVKTVLKRCSSVSPSAEKLRAGNVEVDPDSHRVLVDGRTAQLKEMEFRLLSYLIRNKNRVLTKEELLRNVWPDPYVGDGTLTVHIRRLREKIERDPDRPELIRTVWGTGYRLEDESPEAER